MAQEPLFDPTLLLEMGKVETLTQALAVFQIVGMPARNLSKRTRTEYTHDVGDCIAFLAKRGVMTLPAVSLPHLEAYQAEMDRREYAESSRRRKTYAIKTFFQFLHRHGMMKENVATKLIPPPPTMQEPRFLSKDEYQRLLRVCSHNARDAAMIEVLLQTGICLSELARLTVSSVELPKRVSQDPHDMGFVRVRRRKNAIETIPLNYKACQALAAYLRVRPNVDHTGLFVTKFKTAISPRATQYMVTKYLQEAGIEAASVHTMRHTMATHHVAAGTDLKTLQETLGHASVETTSLYVPLAKKMQRKALQEHAL